MIARHEITGLILAGGRGSRMGGLDKGLQVHDGRPLVELAIARLAPQVGRLMISANRSLETYRLLGLPVYPDDFSVFAGPLAGLLAGLKQCRTAYMAAVPCDSPALPMDLVEQLCAALVSADAEVATPAVAVGGSSLKQPIFCLMRTSVMPILQRDLEAGERKVGAWLAKRRCAEARFTDPAAFANINTLDELRSPG